MYALHLSEKGGNRHNSSSMDQRQGQAKREQGGLRAGTSSGRDATDHKGGKFELKDSQLRKAYNYREEALWFI